MLLVRTGTLTKQIHSMRARWFAWDIKNGRLSLTHRGAQWRRLLFFRVILSNLRQWDITNTSCSHRDINTADTRYTLWKLVDSLGDINNARLWLAHRGAQWKGVIFFRTIARTNISARSGRVHININFNTPNYVVSQIISSSSSVLDWTGICM